MACAEARSAGVGVNDCSVTPAASASARGEAHHEETGDAAFVVVGDGGDGGFHEELAVVLLVHGDTVGARVCGGEGGVCSADEFAADSDLCGEADDAADDVGGCEGIDCCVDVAGVGRVEGGEDDEDFTGAMGWCVA